MDDDIRDGCLSFLLEFVWEVITDWVFWALFPRSIWGWAFWVAVIAAVGFLIFL